MRLDIISTNQYCFMHLTLFLTYFVLNSIVFPFDTISRFHTKSKVWFSWNLTKNYVFFPDFYFKKVVFPWVFLKTDTFSLTQLQNSPLKSLYIFIYITLYILPYLYIYYIYIYIHIFICVIYIININIYIYIYKI